MKKSSILLFLFFNLSVKAQICFSNTVSGYIEIPASISSLDINNDGNMDLIFTGALTQESAVRAFTVFLGDGNGGSISINTTQTEECCHNGLLCQDLNNDGNADVIVTNTNPGTITIYFGNGSGNFLNPTDLFVGTRPQGIVAADLNNDSKIDIGVVRAYSNSMSVLFGTGNGMFSSVTNIPIGEGTAYKIRSADFNLDGKIDLVFNYVTNTANTDGFVKVLINNGTGNSFTAATYLVSTDFTDDLITADLNDDGKMDIVATDRLGSIKILFGNGDGSFLSTSYPTNNRPARLTAADFNGDGNLDIAASGIDQFGNNTSILLGNDQGTFDAPILLLAGDTSNGIVSTDLNNDNRTDIVVTDTNSDRLRFYLNNTINVNITRDGNTLNANIANASYQWIDCSTNLDIPGATGINYTATSIGSYAVKVSKDNCLVTSPCYSVSSLNLESFEDKQPIKIYPNPSKGSFNVEILTRNDVGSIIEIHSILGSQVFSSKIENYGLNCFELSDIEKGIYFVKIYGQKIYTQKLIVE